MKQTIKRPIPMFNGIGKGVFRPSDLDGIVIVGDTLVILEIKYGKASMPIGQQLTLTRLTDSWQAAGKKAMILLARHNIYDTSTTIKIDDLIVTEVYYKKEWIKTDYPLEEVMNKINK